MKPKETFNSISKNVYAIIQGDMLTVFHKDKVLRNGKIRIYKNEPTYQVFAKAYILMVFELSEDHQHAYVYKTRDGIHKDKNTQVEIKLL